MIHYREVVQFGLVGLLLIFEVSHLFLYNMAEETRRASNTINVYLVSIEGILIYTLQYMISIVGPLELAKKQMLNQNLKFFGILFCVLNGFQNAIVSLFLENLIYAF